MLYDAIRTIPDFPEPGIQFKDITPILADPKLLHAAAEAVIAPFREHGITQVVGIESRGFILGGIAAQMLGAGFVPVRKKGKLPYQTFQESYALEYGTDVIEMHMDALHAGDTVLIHDDVIATGGTAAAAYRLAERTGAKVVGFSFLVELGFLSGTEKLPDGVPVHSVLTY